MGNSNGYQSNKVTSLQAELDELPAGETEYSVHGTHKFDVLAPLTGEYVFALQFEQFVLPLIAVYWPAGQFVHAPLPVTVLY